MTGTFSHSKAFTWIVCTLIIGPTSRFVAQAATDKTTIIADSVHPEYQARVGADGKLWIGDGSGGFTVEGTVNAANSVGVTPRDPVLDLVPDRRRQPRRRLHDQGSRPARRSSSRRSPPTQRPCGAEASHNPRRW